MDRTLERGGKVVRGWVAKARPAQVAILSDWFPPPVHPGGTVAFYLAELDGRRFAPSPEVHFWTLRQFLRHYRPRGCVSERAERLLVDSLSEGRWDEHGSVILPRGAPDRTVEAALEVHGLYCPRGADELEWYGPNALVAAEVRGQDGTPLVRLRRIV